MQEIKRSQTDEAGSPNGLAPGHIQHTGTVRTELIASTGRGGEIHSRAIFRSEVDGHIQIGPTDLYQIPETIKVHVAGGSLKACPAPATPGFIKQRESKTHIIQNELGGTCNARVGIQTCGTEHKTFYANGITGGQNGVASH